jgi:predicted RNase H-like nuclease (RuvC/YqgF family)
MIDEDKTYENEVKPTSDDRGSLDLTLIIENLNKKIKNLSGLEKIHKETNGDLRIHILKLDKEIYQLKKDMAFQKETHQMDIIQKDNEIGRLIKKITEK